MRVINGLCVNKDQSGVTSLIVFFCFYCFENALGKDKLKGKPVPSVVTSNRRAKNLFAFNLANAHELREITS